MKAGDKVVCMDGCFSPCDTEVFQNLPKQGLVYVVREAVMGQFTLDGGQVVRREALSVLLVGVNNPPFPGRLEPAFHAARFRLLEEVRRENGLTASAPGEPDDDDQCDCA